ncbi:hypothetical protein NDU88_000907 [Pleurodeles waltl]|uniref:Uncharacterized protein n=1 Tax=Pleurodeles waltl TaxID=8319 RepID=A0AAV7UT83_PLEWA|nr:hypothetical protein NDU88_000907 [Pleurodeles waltl]
MPGSPASSNVQRDHEGSRARACSSLGRGSGLLLAVTQVQIPSDSGRILSDGSRAARVESGGLKVRRGTKEHCLALEEDTEFWRTSKGKGDVAVSQGLTER